MRPRRTYRELYGPFTLYLKSYFYYNSLVIVRMALPVSLDLVEVEVLNVTAAVRLGILPEPALMLPDPLDTGEEEEEEEEEEVTIVSAVITKNLGKLNFWRLSSVIDHSVLATPAGG
jgi:hypothetical protein